MVTLSDYDKNRYSLQILLRDWGEAAQAKLKAASVLIAGAGGLGSPVASYLAAAGLGEIRLCDADRLDLSNLNRQILHPERRLGQLKAISAAQTLRELNPAIDVVAFPEYLDEANLDRIAGRADIVVDCLDNFETRYRLDRFCRQRRIPLVHGAIWGFSGQVTFIQPPATPCLRCLVSEPPPGETFPAIGATPGVIGCLQVMEVLKYLTGIGETLKGRLLLFDGEDMTFMPVKIEPSPSCPECGPRTEAAGARQRG